MTCPRCGQTASFHSHRPKTFVTLVGTVRLCRAYYRCACGASCFPFDRSACLTERSLSLAVEELASLAGLVDDSFAEAADSLLPKLAGLHLGESTVERTSEDVGGLLGEAWEAGTTYGAAKDFDWHKDATGRTVAYAGIDATGVPQQGPKGAKAEGRMPYVATLYNPPPEKAPASPAAVKQHQLPRDAKPVPMQARYLAGLYSLPLLGLLLRKQAEQVGMERAEVWIGISDGGAGLEDFLRTNFNRPDLTIILDFYHPASRLEELAQSWYEGDEERAQQTATGWCKVLKHQGGAALLDHLRSLPPPRRKAARAQYTEMVGYVENHQHKMDYPHYVKQGWQIGSGPVESACKTVVGQRLKQAGMRWGARGTDNVCHLRALLRSGTTQWNAFWQRRINKGSLTYQPK